MLKRLIIIALSLTILGCATSSPMDTKFGLIATPSFDPLFIASAPGNPTKIDYKVGALIYRTSVPVMAELKDTFVIADTGIYLAEWNIDSASYSQELFIPYGNLKSDQVVTIKHDLFPDTEVLRVITTSNETYNFILFKGSVEHANWLIENHRSKKL